MCGIFCSLCVCNCDKCPSSIEQQLQLRELLQNRGPDRNQTLQIEPNLELSGYVLWQQGKEPCAQPVVSENWALLLNGDIFNATKSDKQSDTHWLSQQLDACGSEKEILYLFTTIKGPYSVILYNRKTRDLYFARDSFGRNSLILERNGKCFSTCSTSYIKDTNCESKELPPLGIFRISIDNVRELCLHPWQSLRANQEDDLKNVEKLLSAEIIVKESLNPIWLSKNHFHNEFDLYSILQNKENNSEFIFSELLKTEEVLSKNVQRLLTLIRKSVKERVETTPTQCINCVSNSKANCLHPKVGILFSGGIDCTILAAVANSFINLDTPIDLLNVAFEKNKSDGANSNFDVPDRCSARESYSELQALFPKRKWNLVEVNVSREELVKEMKGHVRNLIHPLNTVLDESLGCAFWFASRGKGILENTPYQTTCRVILVGSGADELFGGYVRHRNAYNRCKGTHSEKIEALRQELDMDWERIPSRNLGRDDRVIADNRKTARSPFIEEDIVAFVRSLRPEQRCCFSLPEGLGDKLLLRLCGHEVGLRASTQFKKRAIQFGSRIADKKQNAKDISVYLQNTTIS